MLSQGSPPVGYEELRGDRGAGAPVVLLHPFPFDRGLWGGLPAALAAHHRVITVDARGFGESPLPGPYTIADLADDLARLLGELGIARATLLGVSMGGYTALAFAAGHPNRLAALILADTRAAADSDETRAARETAMDVVRGAGPKAYLASSLPRLLRPDAPAALVAELHRRAEKRPESLLAGITALRDRPDRSGELAAVRCPTLVVCGEADQVSPIAEMQRMAAAIPNATFVSIAGAGHLAHLEAPGAFERAVSAFLSSAAVAGVAAPAAEAQRA